MRYEETSLSGSVQASAQPDARDDTDGLAHGSRSPASGNTISGAGTISGSAGTDQVEGGRITAIEGAGGRDSSFSGGELRVAGEHGSLSIAADGSYRYTPKAGTPENVRDVFTYTLADGSGATDQARLTIEIGKSPAEVAANAQRIVPGPDGVVVLPAGVDLSDVRVVGRDLIVMLPDGSQMVIVDGAVFVPQLVINNVEVPATNLAALLIDSEPQPAAGNPQSSGGNFGVPVAPLDPGVPLGDLLPPTELGYIPPEFRDPGFALERDNNDPEPDNEIVIGENAVVQLDDDALGGGNPGGTGDDPDGANTSGFLSGSGGDGPLTFDLLTTGAPSGFTYEDGPDGSVLVKQGGTLVLTVTLDPATGAYTVTQNAPIVHPASGEENNVDFPISYTVTDSNGDSATGTLTVNVDDDTPTVDVAAAADAGVTLVTDDADTIGDASDSATSSAAFGGVFSLAFSPGADGTAAAPVLSYALGTAGGASGLTQGGAAINLFLIGTTVVGSTAATAAEVTAGNTVFDVTVDASGTVTLTQYSQIDHGNVDPSPTGAPFSDQLISLVDGAITLTASASYTDRDGDPASDSATIGIGSNLQFSDDGPSIGEVATGAGVVIDETAAGSPAGFPISASSAGAVVSAVALFGADGPAATNAVTYGLAINGGGATPLATAIGDYPITLVQAGPNQIVGQYNDGTGVQTAFTVTINADGTVTVVQNVPLEHLVDGSSAAAHDDALDLAGLIDATVTITDFDGDTASGSAEIGSAIVFRDDGPSATVEIGADGAIVLVTQDGDTIGAAADTASVDFSAIITAGGNAGADGGTVQPASYALGTAGGASGLTQGGAAINLFLIDGVVVGSTATTADAVDASNTVFDVSVSQGGVVTLTQYSQIDHPLGQDPTPGGAPFEDQLASLADNLITLSATSTVVDNDGDTASQTATLNIGANLQFADHGPAISDVALGAGVTIDETAAGKLSGFPISATSAGAVIDVSANFGADGPAAGGSQSFSLAITGSGATGIVTAVGDYPITLVQVDATTIEGRYNSGSGADKVAFTLKMNADGSVTVTQKAPLEHLVDGPPGPAHDDVLNLDGLVEAVVTITDGDGDTATGSAQIGGQIEFRDDGPRAYVDHYSDRKLLLVTQDADTRGEAFDSASVDFSNNIDVGGRAGADGGTILQLVYALGTAGGASGLTQGGTAINLFLIDGVVVGSTATSLADVNASNTVFDVSVSQSGVVTLNQYSQIDHPAALDPTPGGAAYDDQFASLVDSLITLSATTTVIDNDGDTDISTVTFGIGANLQFADDGPAISDVVIGPGVTLDETQAGTPAGFPVSATSAAAVVDASGAFGADGPAASGSESFAIGIVGNGATGIRTAIGDYPITLVQAGPNQIVGQYVDGSGVQTAFTVTMNADGTVTVVQNVPLEHLVDGSSAAAHDDALDLAGLIEATVTITDFDGDTASGSAEIGGTIVFRDDGPSATIEIGADGAVVVVTQDADTVGAAADSASVDFSTIITVGGGGGADGGATQPASYALGTAGGASGLTQGGTAINLFLIGGVVVGSTAATADAVDASNTVFDVSVSQGGVVTLTQYSQIDHPLGQDPTPGDAPYSDQLASLADNLITLSATSTVVDNDGDTASQTATLNIGANLQFADHGPAITDVALGAGVTIDETAAGKLSGFPISATSSAAVIGSIGSFGADGPAASGSERFTIALLGDGSTTLQTAVGDYAITLVEVDANTIEGRYNDGSDRIAFTVTMNADGTVTVVQNVPLEHLVDGSSAAAHDDALDLTGLIEATVVMTDFDGDTASASIEIGGQIEFRDDGPRAYVDHYSDRKLLLVTQDADTRGEAFDSVSVDFSNNIDVGGRAGADGGTILPLVYALGTAGGASGLTQGGTAINLFLIDGVVVGSTASSLADVNASNTVFDVSVSQSGVVTLNQYSQIDHPAALDPTPGGAAYDDQFASLVDSLITLSATTTVIDNDGDTDTSTVTFGIGANLQFADDGPRLTSPATSSSSVTLDETAGASPLSSGAAISATSAAAVISAGVDYGADGQGAGPSYGLSLLNGTTVGTSIASGLSTAAGDFPITLTLTSATTISGTYEDGGTKTAFTITMNANGTVTVTQYTALEHLQDGAAAADHNDALSLVNASLQSLVNATVTHQDADGDTVSTSAGIGNTITFLDDAGTLGAFTPVALTNAPGEVGSGTFAYDQGADGHGAFAITGPALKGVTYSTVQNADGALLTATADPDGEGGKGPVTVFTLQVNVDGTYDFTLVTPEAKTTSTVSLKGLTPGGPTPFVETSDGLVEFTGSGNGVNSSTPGFGISNQFVGNGESFTVEFHSAGQTGNQASNVNPELVSSAVLKNDMINGSLTIKVTFHNDITGEMEVQTLAVTGSSTILDPVTLSQFNWIEVEGVGGNGQGVRFTSLDYIKTVVPQDLDLAFQVSATDQDGDVTSVQTLNVTVDASGTSASSLARTSELQASNSNSVLFAAVAAATGFAALPAAAEPVASPESEAVPGDAQAAMTSFVSRLADDPAGAEKGGSEADGEGARTKDGGAKDRAQSTNREEQESSSAEGEGENQHGAAAVSELLEATDAPVHHAPVPAAEIAMPSVEALANLGGKPDSVGDDTAAKADASIGKVLADALSGGGAGPDIDALLAALPDANAVNGAENPATEGLASHLPAAVPGWDSGHFAGLPHGPAFMMEAAVLHHDAVQPA